MTRSVSLLFLGCVWAIVSSLLAGHMLSSHRLISLFLHIFHLLVRVLKLERYVLATLL